MLKLFYVKSFSSFACFEVFFIHSFQKQTRKCWKEKKTINWCISSNKVFRNRRNQTHRIKGGIDIMHCTKKREKKNKFEKFVLKKKKKKKMIRRSFPPQVFPSCSRNSSRKVKPWFCKRGVYKWRHESFEISLRMSWCSRLI